MTSTIRNLLTALCVLLAASTATAQGITIKRTGVVLFGSTANCTQPATVNWNKVRKATPEWKKILSEGVETGTGRYDLLISRMNARIKRAAAKAADAGGRDCVVRKGDIKSANGLGVADLTSEVIDELDA